MRQSGVGDVELAAKRVLFADRAGTRIVSGGFEVAFPTGSAPRGPGEGTTRFEPFVAAAWARDGLSLQMTAALELPKNAPWSDHALEYRAYRGRDLSRAARKWTLGVELTGENTELAVTPQVRKGLVKTGALAAALGVQIPATERAEQQARLVGYLLWDYREPVRR